MHFTRIDNNVEHRLSESVLTSIIDLGCVVHQWDWWYFRGRP